MQQEFNSPTEYQFNAGSDMTVFGKPDSMYLLFSFERGCSRKTKSESGDVIDEYGCETVSCRLWFDSTDEMQQFIKEHTSIMIPKNPMFRHEVKWADYTTIDKKSYKNMVSK